MALRHSGDRRLRLRVMQASAAGLFHYMSGFATKIQGDVIPISIDANVPVMVGRDRLGCGTVGTANGRAAIRLTSIAIPEGLDQ